MCSEDYYYKQHAYSECNINFYEDVLPKIVHWTSRYINFVIRDIHDMIALYSETLLHWKSLHMQALPT